MLAPISELICQFDDVDCLFCQSCGATPWHQGQSKTLTGLLIHLKWVRFRLWVARTVAVWQERRQ